MSWIFKKRTEEEKRELDINIDSNIKCVSKYTCRDGTDYNSRELAVEHEKYLLLSAKFLREGWNFNRSITEFIRNSDEVIKILEQK